MNKIGLSVLAVAAMLAEPSGAHAPDGDFQSPSQGGALSASACDALPSAMPGWPYYLIWDYDDYAEPFVLGRGTVTGDYFYYDRPFRQGVLGANLRVETNEYDAVPTAVLMGRALAAVPRVLSQQLPPIRLEIAGHYANAQFLRGFFPDSYTVRFPLRYVHGDNAGRPVLGNNHQHRNFEELLIHELAHALDSYSGTPSSSDAWLNAIHQSPCAVSEYAQTAGHLEDFAESVVAYLAYYAGRNGALSGTERRNLKTRLGKRWSVLVRMFHRQAYAP